MNNERLSTNEQQDNETVNQPVLDEQRKSIAPPSAEHQRQAEKMGTATDTITPCWTGAQRLAELSIEAMDHVGRQTLSLHEQLSQWAKATSWAPILQAQHDYLQQWLNDSARSARVLWKLDAEKAVVSNAKRNDL